MNHVPSILEILAQAPDMAEVLITSGTRLMRRDRNGLTPVGDTPLSDQDVRDTLTALIAHSKTIAPKARNGVFSFGIPQRGRFRVGFMTQRGSYVASILKVPFEVPSLLDLVADPAAAELIRQKFLSCGDGLLLITGAAPMVANLFAYALLRAYNEQLSRMMCLIEPGLTFLLRHQRSFVLQCEIGTDVDNVGEALHAALNLSPDLIYVRDVSLVPELDLLMRAVEAHVFTVATVPVLDASTLLAHGRAVLPAHQVHGLWRLDYTEGEKLRVTMA
jgi:twitching motility protein PilT